MAVINPKEFAKEFERTIALGKAKAYSNVSLERPLTDNEFQEYKKQMDTFTKEDVIKLNERKIKELKNHNKQ